MSEDLVGIRVNGTLWEVADVDARKALETKLTTPDGGTQGQVLTRTVDGYTWQSVAYTAGTGIEITSGNVINCTVEQKDPLVYTGGANISISSNNVIDITDNVALKSDIKTYTAGEGITIAGNTISIDFTKAAVKEHYHGMEAINGLSLTLESKANQDAFELLDQEVDGLQEDVTEISNSLGDINTILDKINGEEV